MDEGLLTRIWVTTKQLHHKVPPYYRWWPHESYFIQTLHYLLLQWHCYLLLSQILRTSLYILTKGMRLICNSLNYILFICYFIILFYKFLLPMGKNTLGFLLFFIGHWHFYLVWSSTKHSLICYCVLATLCSWHKRSRYAKQCMVTIVNLIVGKAGHKHELVILFTRLHIEQYVSKWGSYSCHLRPEQHLWEC